MRISSTCVALVLLAGCSGGSKTSPIDGGLRTDAGVPDAGPGDASYLATGLEAVPLQTTLSAPSLGNPVDVVRDTYGNPHIYGNSLPDIVYAQGYMVAHDRLIQIDFERHSADGTLSYLLGGASPSVLAQDIQMRIHHLRSQAETFYATLAASSDPQDVLLKAVLDSFAAGVNAYWADLNAGVYSLPLDYAAVYQPASFEPWTGIDSALLGELLTFQLAFDAADDIQNSALLTEGAATFDNSTNPALAARAGIGEDLQVIAPADPTTTISGGWTGFNGDTSTAIRERIRRLRQHTHGKGGAPFAPSGRLLQDDLKALASLEAGATGHLRGSNNWIVGPQLSANGDVLVANDTHLSVQNPATFWINHLVNRGSDQPLNVMGEQLPGDPFICLGLNQHIAWGLTDNYIDVTDVYQETIVACPGDAGPCAQFQGQLVPLVPTVQTFQMGYIGTVGSTVQFTTYSVPEHGPIIPRVLTDASGNVTGLDALRSQELSIRYTGYTSAPLLKAIFSLNVADSFDEAKAAVDQNFGYGGENWVIGDDQGNFGWTQYCWVPVRPVSTQNFPWQVLPGDGSAEWGAAWMDPHYIPHAIQPAKGFIATSNNDPIGSTLTNSPFVGQPVAVDGGQLYLGTNYDPGTRVGRTTRRLEALADAGRITLDDMQSIQADTISEWGQGFAPTFLDSASALLAEAAALADAGITQIPDGGTGMDGGTGPYPELAPMLLAARAAADGGFSVALLQQAHDLVAGWTFDTPTGVAEDSPTPQQISDSQATLVMAFWTSHFAHDTLDDELALFDPSQVAINELEEEKLMHFLVQSPLPSFLKTQVSPVTGDSILFDNLATPGVIESKRMIGAQAAIEAVEAITQRLGANTAQWAWGDVHTLTLGFFLGPGIADSLNVPPPGDPTYPNGFPRHGENGTVDVAPHGLDVANFTQENLGPAIRFVAELTPSGPIGRNALPGGEIFDPSSPHYRDQMELWRKNQTFDFAFQDADVIAAAMQECQANSLCRIRFQP